MAVDVNREIRRAVDTGRAELGVKQSERSILKGNCQLVVISKNAVKRQKERIQQLCKVAGTPFFECNLTGLQLGSVCGKPFVVSFMAVEKVGKSKILEAVKQGSKGKA